MINQKTRIMKTNTYLVATLVCSLLSLHATAADRPNIVVMMVDDMGFAGPSIAPYGNPHYETPGMDRLASEGMLFTDKPEEGDEPPPSGTDNDDGPEPSSPGSRGPHLRVVK